MEQRLHEILMDGEQVRWTGRPSPFKLCVSRPETFFATWLLSGAAVLLALFYLLPALDSTQRGGADWFVMLVVVAFLPAMLSLRPLMDKFCLEKNTLYAITDRRVIALVKDDLMYIPLDQKPAVSVEGRDRDCGQPLLRRGCGAAGAGNSRSNAVLGIRESSARMICLGCCSTMSATLSSFCIILPDAAPWEPSLLPGAPNFPEQPSSSPLS